MPVATLPEQDALTQPLDIKEGDRLHFLGDGTVEVVRDKKRMWLVKSDYIPSVSLRKRAAPGEAKQLETEKGAGSKSKEHPPIPAGARWISIHPGGNEGAKAIPLLIMPHEDGSASVIGGASGRLNLLKLDSLKSPEEWKESAQKRATEKRKKEKERVEGQPDEEKEKEKKAKDEVAEFKQTATHENALRTLEAFEKSGVDIGLSAEHKLALQTPPDPGTEPEKVEEWQRLTREASQKVKAIHQAYEKKLVTDHSARAAAQLGDGDLDTNNRLIENSAHTAAAPDGSTISEIVQLPGGSWLVKGDEARQFDNWKDAAKQHLRNVLEGEQAVGGDRTQGDSFYSPSNWVKDVKDEQLPEGFQFKPEVALEIARLSAERKAADKQALTAEDAIKKRSILEGGGIDLGPVRKITQREVLDKLEAQAKTLKDAAINGNFLKVIDDVGDADKLKKHHSTGGWSAIAEVASEVFKQTPISRELVDLLGHNEAGKVLANMMALNLSDDDYEATKEAIAAYHAKQSTLHAKGAVKQVGKIQERLASLHEEMIGLTEFSEGMLDPVQQIQMDSMLYEAQTLNDSIQQILGTRLGQLQATAAVIAAMEAKPKTLRFSGETAKKLMEHVPGLYGGDTKDPTAGDDPEEGRSGDSAENARPSIFEAYGLTAEDFKVFPGPDGDVIQVNPSGLNKLSVGYNPEDQEAYERAVAIKRGDFDEEDFVPAGFSHYQPITEYQPADLANGYGVKLDVNESMSDDEMTGKIRDYFGAVVANGISPADARDGIYNRDFVRSMGIDPDSELGDRIYKNVGNFILDIAEVQDEKLGRRVSVPKMIAALEELSQQHQEKQWQSGEGVNGKGLKHDVATEAAHRTLADMPVARLALKQWEDLSGKEKQQIRDYAIEEVWKPSRGDSTDGFVKVESLSGAEEVARALALPGKDGETKSVGGQNYAYHKGEGRWLTQQDYDGKRKAEEEAANTEQGGLFDFGDFGSDEPAAAPSQSLAEQQEQQELENTDEYWDGIKDTDDPWTQFSKLMGGGDRASKVALEHLRGQFNSRFAHAYSQLAGEPAPVVSTTHSHYQNLMTAKLPEGQRKKFLKWQRDRDQSDASKIRQRVGGKFAKEDDDWYDQYQQLKGGALQGNLGVGDDEETAPSRPSGGSYTALGKQAQLDMNSVLEKVLPNFDQISAPKVGIINRVNWSKGTQHDMKQRVLKLLEAQKKIGLHAGAGCVHGSTLLRCEKTGIEQSFYDWCVSGDRPFVKALDESTGRFVAVQSSKVFVKAIDPMYRVTLGDGSSIVVTADHRFLGRDGWSKLRDLPVGSELAIATQIDPWNSVDDACTFGEPLQKSSPVKHPIQVGASTPFGELESGTFPNTNQPLCCLCQAPPQSASLTSPDSRKGLLAPTPLHHESAERQSACGEFHTTSEETQSYKFVPQAWTRSHSLTSSGQDTNSLALVRSSPALPHARGADAWPRIRTALNCWDDYFACSRQYDEQPPLGLGIDLEPAPLPICVPEQSLCDSHKDALSHEHRRSHGCQLSCHHCSTLGWPRPSCNACGGECHTQPDSFESSFDLPPSLGQSPKSSSPHRNKDVSALLRQHESCFSWSQILSVEEVGLNLVFDITVPIFHNYLAHGIVNHNSGKSATMLGAFSHLHAQGKVRKLVTCVPSSIVGQFVGEAVTFLEPGKFNYAANLGWDRERRLAALKDPNMHVYVTTRESMTNDLMHLVEKHTGIDSETFREKPEAEQHELLLKGCKAEGIDTEGLLLAIDEAHDISSRKGVKASKRSLALKGLAQHSSYYIEATGDPTKNSASEAYSFLHAVDPAKFNDLNKFMAEYGQDSSASKRSLQRAIAPYSFAFSTKPQTKGENGVSGRTLKMNINQPTIKASERVAKERQRILDDVGLISAWQTQRREQLKEQHGEGYQPTTEDFNTAWDNETVRGAIDRLGSQNTWHSLDDNGKKAAIGGQIRAMGGLKRTAMFRLVHLTPYEDNPKMQWTVNHAVEQHKAGKPGIIFSSSSEACGMMKEQLEKQGLKVAYIHGGLDGSGKDAQRIMFQDSGEADVLIATDAARTGVNLTRGKYVTHYDVPLTEMGFAQRSARSYRLKQTEDVDIHVPMLDMPEEKMALARMERKGREGKVFKTSSETIDQTGMARKVREARAMRKAV